MAGTLADTGATKINEVMFIDTAKPTSYTIHLFVNDASISDTTAAVDLTEASGGGYSSKTIQASVAHIAAAAITSSSAANPTVITTSSAHGLTTNDYVSIVSHTGSAQNINGTHQVTVTAGSTFTIAVDLTSGGGTGGTFSRGFNSTTSGGISVIQPTTLAWVFTGALDSTATIYGFYVLSNDSTFMYAEKFSSSYTPAANGDTLNLDITIKTSKGTAT